MKNKIYDEDRIVELYKKYGSYNRAALSAGCSPGKVKSVILGKGIEVKEYVPARFNIKTTLKG